ncbi:MAG TPA: hypothetical protein VFG49_10700 [Dyella sp.]|uniref:hypothetical protein n=1 Tax=Dyella sp. TaxID=1869338 RepID=UPI002D76C756|nr:hypothetical protein [Dyella sp.]HET6553993.1 hypothetical protein [Dyella sp.]
MKSVAFWLSFLLRIAFGALFVFSGINDLLHFWQPPAPATPQSQVFMQGLAGSGYVFPVLGVVYTVSGLCLLANRFVALALLMLAAPIVVIFGYHVVMEHHVGPGVTVLIAYLILAWQQRATLAILLRPSAPVAANG